MEIEIDFLGKKQTIGIGKSHFLRRLGFPKDYDVPEHIQESMDWSAEWYQEKGNPWLYIFELGAELKDDKLYLNDKRTEAPKVYKRFLKYDVKKAMLIAATAGDKVDKKAKDLWSSDYPDRSFFLETYASCVTETLVEFAVEQIRFWALQKQEKALSRYSPGYPGWELKEQEILMEIASGLSEDLPISISDTSLLQPLKSQMSLVGIHRGDQEEKELKIECMQCTFNDCACMKKEMYIKI